MAIVRRNFAWNTAFVPAGDSDRLAMMRRAPVTANALTTAVSVDIALSPVFEKKVMTDLRGSAAMESQESLECGLRLMSTFTIPSLRSADRNASGETREVSTIR